MAFYGCCLGMESEYTSGLLQGGYGGGYQQGGGGYQQVRLSATLD